MRRFARVALLFLGCGVCSLLYGVSQLALSLEQEAGGARQRQARDSAAAGGGRQAGNAGRGEEGAGRYGPGPRSFQAGAGRAARRPRAAPTGGSPDRERPAEGCEEGRAVPRSELGCCEGLLGSGAAASDSVN